MPAFSQSVRIPAHVLVRQLAGESVLLNLQTERYFGLDEVGTRMWTHLTSSVSIEAAYQNLLEEYEVEGKVLRRNLSDLLDRIKISLCLAHYLSDLCGQNSIAGGRRTARPYEDNSLEIPFGVR